MTPNPVSIHGSATIPEVIAFLTDTGFSAAPVIDESGRPIGVVSRTDIVVYDRARVGSAEEMPLSGDQPDRAAALPEAPPPVSAAASAPVVRASDLMTPTIFAVPPETPALETAEEMVRLNVHRLFVVDRDGILIGVISVLDLLRHFCLETRGVES